MVLRLIGRGLNLTQVGFVFAVYGAVTALLELPTGGLADALGRKSVLLLATVFDASLAIGVLLGRTLWHFLIAAALGAIGRALLSGPLESWYVDTSRAVDPAIVLRPALSAAGVVEALAFAGGAILSASLPLLATALDIDNKESLLSLPIIAALVAEAASFVALLILIVETRRWRYTKSTVLGNVRSLVAGGLRLAISNRDLRLIFSGTFAAVTAMVAVELLWQPRFAALLGSAAAAAKVNGFFVAGLSLASAGGSWFANHLPGGLGRHGGLAAAAAALGSAAALGWLAVSNVFAWAAIACLVLYATTAAVSVIRSELLHDRVSGDRRATMVSTLSMSQQGGNLFASLTLARLADVAGIPLAWSIGAGLFVIQATLFAHVRPLRVRTVMTSPP